MIFVMKQSTLEPGFLQTLRVYVLVIALLLPVTWHSFSPTFGVEGNLQQLLTPGMPILLFLLIYLWFPWWQRHMGGLFMPLAFLLLAAQSVLGNYLTLQWLVPPPLRDFTAVALMLRTWVTIQFLVLFVAWQYDLFWMIVSAIGLSMLDAALYFPFVKDSTTFYPFYSALVVARFFGVTGVGLGFAWL